MIPLKWSYNVSKNNMSLWSNLNSGVYTWKVFLMLKTRLSHIWKYFEFNLRIMEIFLIIRFYLGIFWQTSAKMLINNSNLVCWFYLLHHENSIILLDSRLKQLDQNYNMNVQPIDKPICQLFLILRRSWVNLSFNKRTMFIMISRLLIAFKEEFNLRMYSFSKPGSKLVQVSMWNLASY